jgi:kynurenine formamidase
MQLIDLSITLEPVSSEPVPVAIDYVSHSEGADILGKPVGIDHSHFPDGMGLSLEYVRLTTHSGTHLDAPIHYGPFSEGKPARTIEDIPLEWCLSDGVVLDCTTQTTEPISSQEIQSELERIGYTLKPLDIVLLRTGADRLWGSPEYFTDFRGVSREATAWLVTQGIKVIGIDSFGFDPPFGRMLADYQREGRAELLWPAHLYGREREYCQIERLVHLDRLPQPSGFKVTCFPIKLRQCGAGWTRVIAIYEEPLS